MGTRTGTYYTGTMTGQVGSLITALDAILVTGEGWTKTFSGTNKAVYTQAGGNGFCIRVVDDGSTSAGGAREALVRGAESASSVDVLIDPWPFTSYWSDALCCWRKSDTADATARSYWAVADDKFLIMFVRFGTTAGDLYKFGDLEPFWTGDNYCTVINHRGVNNTTTAMQSNATSIATTYSSAQNTRYHLARRADGLVKFVNGMLLSANNNFGTYGTAGADYPGVSTTQLHMQPCAVIGTESQAFSGIVSAAAMPRGAIPYLFEMLHGPVVGIADADTFTATSYDASSQFIIFSSNGSFAGGNQRIILQTAGTWDPGF